jgi:hypothetical protein
MVIKNIKEVDNIANEIFNGKTHLLSIDYTEYEHLKENSSSIEVIKIDIPILTNDSIASIEDELTTIEENTISSGIFCICENNTLTMNQMEKLSSVIIKHINIKNFKFGLSGFSKFPKGAEIYIFIGIY